MKVLVISDIHGSGYYAEKIKEINEKEKPEKNKTTKHKQPKSKKKKSKERG